MDRIRLPRGADVDTARLFVSVLGPLRLEFGGDAVTVRPPQARALLALLVLRRGEVVSTSRLICELWEDDPPPSARVQLQGLVSTLRRLLAKCETAPSWIITTPTGYQMKIEEGELDLDLFHQEVAAGRGLLEQGLAEAAAQRLRAALDRWNGDAFADISLPAVRQMATHIDELRMAVLEDRVAAELATGAGGGLITELRQRLDEHPFRERMRGQLMTALARAGRVPDALQLYREGRRQLIDALGIEPSGSLHGIYVGILRGEIGLSAQRERPPLREVAVPHLLPSDLRDFTGREALVDGLAQMLAHEGERRAPLVVAVTGPGGVGKSALAVHMGHKLRGAFPDGQLFVRLNGSQPDPVPAAEALARFLRALGVAAGAIPNGVEERAELYRHLVSGRRMLVVVDDVSNEEQLRPLLPGEPGCAVLATSRRRLAGVEGTHFAPLRVLSEADSTALLRRIVGGDRLSAEPRAAAELVTLCGGLPLALRVAAARLTHRPHWTVADFVTRLADQRRRLDWLRAGDVAVRATITLSYEQLPPDQQRLFRRLGLLDTPDFATWVAAAVLDSGEDDAERLLEDLLDCHLVESAGRCATGPRYRLHDLIRLVARELAEQCEPAGQVAAALDRAIDGWFAVAAVADEALQRHPADPEPAPAWLPPPSVLHAAAADPMTWFADERSALLVAVRQAADSGRSARAWTIAQRLYGYLDLVGYLDEQDSLLRNGLNAAVKAGDRRGEACMLHRMAHAQNTRDDFTAAGVAIDRASALYRDLGDAQGIACLVGRSAHLARMAGDVPRAVELGQKAVAVAEDAGDPAVLADALTELSLALRDAGRPAEALVLLERARTLDVADVMRSWVLHVLGVQLRDAGRLSEAEKPLLEAYRMVEGLRADRLVATTGVTLALLYGKQGRDSEAERLASRSLETFRLIGQPWGVGRSLSVLGLVARARGDHRSAAAHCREALAIWRRLGIPKRAGEMLGALAEICAEMGDTEAAAVYRRELDT